MERQRKEANRFDYLYKSVLWWMDLWLKSEVIHAGWSQRWSKHVWKTRWREQVDVRVSPRHELRLQGQAQMEGERIDHPKKVDVYLQFCCCSHAHRCIRCIMHISAPVGSSWNMHMHCTNPGPSVVASTMFLTRQSLRRQC